MPAGANTVVCICLTPSVADVQRMLLEQHGYRVFVATNFHEVLNLARRTELNCALICADIEPKMKRAIASMLEEKFLRTSILEIGPISPEMEGLPRVLSDSPEDVLAAVDDLMRPNGKRFNQVVQRRAANARRRARETVRLARELRNIAGQLRPKHRRRDKTPHA